MCRIHERVDLSIREAAQRTPPGFARGYVRPRALKRIEAYDAKATQSYVRPAGQTWGSRATRAHYARSREPKPAHLTFTAAWGITLAYLHDAFAFTRQ